jgi:hypothetical protein
MASTKGNDRLHGFLSLLGKAADYVSHTSHKAPVREPLTLKALALVPLEPGAPISPPEIPLEAAQFDVEIESAPSVAEEAEPVSPNMTAVPTSPRPSPAEVVPQVEAVSTQVSEEQEPAATQFHVPLSPLPASLLPQLASPVVQHLQLANEPSVDALPLPSATPASFQHAIASAHQRPPTPDSPLSPMSDPDDNDSEGDRSPKRRRTADTIEPFRVWRTLISDFGTSQHFLQSLSLNPFSWYYCCIIVLDEQKNVRRLNSITNMRENGVQ